MGSNPTPGVQLFFIFFYHLIFMKNDINAVIHMYFMSREHFVYILTFVLLLSLFAPVINSALAGPEDILWSDARPYRAISPLIPESGMNFLEPVSKVFSGAAQGVVRGEDVRFANAKK